jgi:glycosyltransferase involved in cell wall biosynthesis
MSARKKKIIVVLPAYNAAKTLEKTYKGIPVGSYDEVIVVDDSSNDATATVAKRLGLPLIIHPQNKGYGGNQKTCYTEALKRGADIIVMLHPDYQYDPTILPSMTAPLLYDYADIVLGSRILGDPHAGGSIEGGMPIYKFIANKLLTTLQNKLLHMHLSEYHTGYRAYSRKSLQAIDFMSFSDDFIFDNQILIAYIKKGMRFFEVPVKTRYFKEASSINFKSSVQYGTAVIGNTLQARFKKYDKK